MPVPPGSPVPVPRSPGAPLPGSVCSAALPVAGVPPPPPTPPGVTRVPAAAGPADGAGGAGLGSPPHPRLGPPPGPSQARQEDRIPPPTRPGLPSRACLGCPFAGLGGGAAPPGHPRVGVGAPTRGRSSRAAPPQPLGTVWVFLGGECSSPLSPIRCQPWLPGASPPPPKPDRGVRGGPSTPGSGVCRRVSPPPPPSLPRASPPARDKLFFHPTSAPAAVTRGRPRRGGGAEKPTPRASAKAGCAGQS